MTKFNSLLCSLALMLAGCGGGGGGETTTPPAPEVSTINAVDGYVIKLTSPAVARCGINTYESQLTVGSKGELTFSGITLDGDCTITIPSDAYIDVNNNGLFDNDDTILGFELTAPGDMQYVSQLTTLLMQKQETDEYTDLQTALEDFDPVEAANTIITSSDENVVLLNQKLLILAEVLKTVLNNGSVDFIADIDTTPFLDDTSLGDLDVNETLSTSIKSNQALSDAVIAKANVMALLVDEIDGLNDYVDVSTLLVSISDGKNNMSEAFEVSKKEGASKDDFNSLVGPIDVAIQISEDKVNAIVPPLVINQDGNFSKTHSASEDTLSQIWDLVIPLSSIQDIDDLNITVEIEKELSGTKGYITFESMKIKNQTLETPTSLSVYGVKTNDDSSSTEYPETHTITKNSIKIINDDLYINLSYIMLNQTYVSSSSFIGISNYNIKVYINNLSVQNAADLKNETMVPKDSSLNTTYPVGTSLISGDIIIKEKYD